MIFSKLQDNLNGVRAWHTETVSHDYIITLCLSFRQNGYKASRRRKDSRDVEMLPGYFKSLSKAKDAVVAAADEAEKVRQWN